MHFWFCYSRSEIFDLFEKFSLLVVFILGRMTCILVTRCGQITVVGICCCCTLPSSIISHILSLPQWHVLKKMLEVTYIVLIGEFFTTFLQAEFYEIITDWYNTFIVVWYLSIVLLTALKYTEDKVVFCSLKLSVQIFKLKLYFLSCSVLPRRTKSCWQRARGWKIYMCDEK
jgi:hypothetical protein